MAQARAQSGFAIWSHGLVALAGAISCASSACGSSPGGPADPSAGDAGLVAVEAGLVVVLAPPACPGISSFAIDTTDLGRGQTANASIVTTGPAPSFVRWSVVPASGGVFSDAASFHTAFTCAGPGSVTVGVKVGLTAQGSGNLCEGVAFTSYEAPVRCDG